MSSWRNLYRARSSNLCDDDLAHSADADSSCEFAAFLCCSTHKTNCRELAGPPPFGLTLSGVFGIFALRFGKLLIIPSTPSVVFRLHLVKQSAHQPRMVTDIRPTQADGS